MRGRCCNFRWNAINPNTADVLYIHVSTEINVSETHFKTVLHNDSPLLLLLFSLRPLLPPFYPPLSCTTIFHFFFFIISLKKRLSFFSFWVDEVQVLLFFFSIFSFFFFFFATDIETRRRDQLTAIKIRPFDGSLVWTKNFEKPHFRPRFRRTKRFRPKNTRSSSPY